MDISQGQLIQAKPNISNGGTTSTSISTTGLSLVGIQVPAAFTGTAFTFLAAMTESGPYQPMYNKSGEVSYPVVQGQYVAIDPQDFYGVPYLQIVSNADEGAARTLICSLKGI